MPSSEHRDFEQWFDRLWERHTSELTFQEIRKAVQALSRSYVQLRGRSPESALQTAGKRAGFALFYGPLHFLIVRAICRELHVRDTSIDRLVDLGCGTGVSGAAWALQAGRRTELLGIDSSSWATRETSWMYRQLRLRGRTRCMNLVRASLPGAGAGIIAAFTLNELGETERERMRVTLLEAASRGASVLIVEPIARRLTPWWGDWACQFRREGGRADEWRFPITLPDRLSLMDKASGLDHRELTGRSLWLHHDSPDPECIPSSGSD